MLNIERYFESKKRENNFITINFKVMFIGIYGHLVILKYKCVEFENYSILYIELLTRKSFTKIVNVKKEQ